MDLDHSPAHRRRRQFGRSIAQVQGVRFTLADTATRLPPGDFPRGRAARPRPAVRQRGVDGEPVCFIGGVRAADAGPQIHGGIGFVEDALEEAPIGRF
jgi:hypothetical protein